MDITIVFMLSKVFDKESTKSLKDTLHSYSSGPNGHQVYPLIVDIFKLPTEFNDQLMACNTSGLIPEKFTVTDYSDFYYEETMFRSYLVLKLFQLSNESLVLNVFSEKFLPLNFYNDN
jgi:hypothetical protein